MAMILRLIPWQAWAVGALVIAAGGYHWHAVTASYRAGYAAAIAKQEKANADAEKRAEAELRRLDRGDRSVVRGFDRD